MSPRRLEPLSEEVLAAARGELGRDALTELLEVVEKARDWRRRVTVRGVDYGLFRAVDDLERSLERAGIRRAG